MPKSSWIPLIVIPLVVILAVVGGRFFYYGSSANAYTAPDRGRAEVKVDSAPLSARIEAVDNPTVSKGVVVIDYAHSNALFIEELNVLLSKIVNRGFSYEIVAEDGEKEHQGLADKLRYAKALILPLPRIEYTPEEVTEIQHFVEKGGRVLIIGDPTRTISVEALNTIGGAFSIIFANDYLYSLEHNDNNYRNVVYSNFKDSPLTSGLGKDDKLIFYSAGSINAPDHEIILGDETTHSSVSEGGRAMAVAALTTNDQVLGLGDLTFLGEPYSAAEKNGTFINNIADFLTGGQRDFELNDFPYFFNTNVDIVFDNTLVFNSQFDDSVKLKELLEGTDRNVTFVNEIGTDNDVIFVGRFDDVKAIQGFLDRAHISIIGPDEKPVPEETPEAESSSQQSTLISDKEEVSQEERFITGRIKIEGVGDLERGGSTLFYLYRDQNRNVLIILSDNPDTNADAFELLFDNKLADCLASPVIAVCQTEKPDGKLPPSLRSTRIDKILVVSDDAGRKREDAETGALMFQNVLSATYKVDTWLISKDGSPDIDQLLEYDAVIWTTGDYWDDSIAEEDVALLTKYVEVGGNLILSGASIAFDWDHTDFLTKVVHADYLGVAEQKDLELVLPDHPIAKDFAEDAVITFLDTPSGKPLEPDVVSQTTDARVIFQRGPDSKQKGAPAVIAYEDNRVKIAYYAFPAYLLPPEEGALLINNTVDWFTKKPLDLPDAEKNKAFTKNQEEEQQTGEGQNQNGENGNSNGNQDNGQDNSNQDNGNQDNGNNNDGG